MSNAERAEGDLVNSPDESSAGRRTMKLTSGLQFSLFELLALILFGGLGVAALRSGGTVALILVQAALWTFTGIALTALVARGSWQAFAIGFVLGVAGYGIPALYVGQSELDPYDARLPLTKTLLPVWEVVHRDLYVDPATGEEFESDQVTATQTPGGGVGYSGGTFGGSMNGFVFTSSGMPYPMTVYLTADGRSVNQTEKPDRYQFMLVAHALLSIAIGYVFGKFAGMVYRRRTELSTDGASRDGLGGLTNPARIDT